MNFTEYPSSFEWSYDEWLSRVLPVVIEEFHEPVHVITEGRMIPGVDDQNFLPEDAVFIRLTPRLGGFPHVYVIPTEVSGIPTSTVHDFPDVFVGFLGSPWRDIAMVRLYRRLRMAFGLEPSS